MDQWRNDAPALAYVKDLCTWVIVNNNSQPISWTEDPVELASLLIWVLEYGGIEEKQRFRPTKSLKRVSARLKRNSGSRTN